MSRRAKSEDRAIATRYFVEEQLVAPVALLLAIVIWALLGTGAVATEFRTGLFGMWGSSLVLYAAAVGFLSQGTGVFGTLIFLDKREHSFCVPVNRSSSVLAGVAASVALTVIVDAPPPHTSELVAAGLLVVAILFLALVPRRYTAGGEGRPA